MTCYSSTRLVEEVACVAFNLHWSYEQIMGMDHQERRRWVDEARRQRAAAERPGEGPAWR